MLDGDQYKKAMIAHEKGILKKIAARNMMLRSCILLQNMMSTWKIVKINALLRLQFLKAIQLKTLILGTSASTKAVGQFSQQFMKIELSQIV